MAIFGKIFGQKRAPAAPLHLSPLPPGLDSSIGGTERFAQGLGTSSIDDQLATLMAGLKEDAVALKCQQEKALSDWQFGMDHLSDRMTTLQPLLAKSIKAGAEREEALSRSVSAEKDLKHRLAQAERDLAHYKPLALQFETELRTLRHDHAMAQSSAIASENECRKALGMVNDLQQRLAITDAERQKLQENHNAYRQKLQKHEVALPTLVREAAQLKSDLAVAQNARDHLENELKAITRKFSAECEDHNRDREILAQVQARFTQVQHESQARVAEAEARAGAAAEKASSCEQRIHDLEIRQSALLSKIDFLERINQRQRDDLRRQSDHIGNLEASNRQLLETVPPVAFIPREAATLVEPESAPQVLSSAARAGARHGRERLQKAALKSGVASAS